MRQIEIDLTTEKAKPPVQAVGYVGEHNATELLISVPRALIDASDYQVVVFQSGPLIFRSRRIYPDSDRNGAYREGVCIHCLLGRHLTEEQRLGLQVEAYKLGEDGEPVLVGKTAFIPRLTLMASLAYKADNADYKRGVLMEERIKAKLLELAAQKEQALAQLNAILGAEQALRQLLEKEVTPDER